MKKVLKKHNLFLNNVFKTSVHGTSYVFEISMSNKIGNISDVLVQELESGLFDVDFYIKYSKKCLLCVQSLKKKIDAYKKKKYKIIGYGAAAKGNTLLNFSNISLDYIVDDNPLKQGMYTPGMNIPIVSIEKLNEFSKKDKICFVPLAWNFYEEIKNRIRKFRNFKSDKIIKYFPFYSEEIL